MVAVSAYMSDTRGSGVLSSAFIPAHLEMSVADITNPDLSDLDSSRHLPIL